MTWQGDNYRYGQKELRTIAELYKDIAVDSAIGVIEKKADFDNALNSLGKGHWTGWLEDIQPFRYYRGFSRLQRVIIADILGMTDYELRWMGFNAVGYLRARAYYRMQKFLNGW